MIVCNCYIRTLIKRVFLLNFLKFIAILTLQFSGNGFGDAPSTEDPFRQAPPTPTTTTEFNYNQFQNNEVGSNQPFDPFPSNFDRNRPRPQVDEFGNPLGEIYNVDTTRFELGVGIESEDLR